MTKPEIVAKLKEAEVEFDENLTKKELIEQFPEILSEEDEDDTDENEDSDSFKSDPKVKKITFKVRSSNTVTEKGKVKQGAKVVGFVLRTFTESDHGENFQELAHSFEVANTHVKAIKPTNEQDAEGQRQYREAAEFNANIKHPILSKTVE